MFNTLNHLYSEYMYVVYRYRGKHLFFAPKHRLWVLIRTASVLTYLQNVLGYTISTFFRMEFSTFTALKIFSVYFMDIFCNELQWYTT